MQCLCFMCQQKGKSGLRLDLLRKIHTVVKQKYQEKMNFMNCSVTL